MDIIKSSGNKLERNVIESKEHKDIKKLSEFLENLIILAREKGLANLWEYIDEIGLEKENIVLYRILQETLVSDDWKENLQSILNEYFDITIIKDYYNVSIVQFFVACMNSKFSLREFNFFCEELLKIVDKDINEEEKINLVSKILEAIEKPEKDKKERTELLKTFNWNYHDGIDYESFTKGVKNNNLFNTLNTEIKKISSYYRNELEKIGEDQYKERELRVKCDGLREQCMKDNLTQQVINNAVNELSQEEKDLLKGFKITLEYNEFGLSLKAQKQQ